jgi:hypothetical protein
MGLTWAQVQDVFELAKLAQQAKRPLNAFVTFRANDRCLTDGDRKRDLSRKVAHFSQAVKGRGRVPRQAHFVGVTTYEKRPGGALHAHLLAHVEDFSFARQLGDGDVIHVIRAKPHHLGYITKQRLPGSPEFEATCRHRRQSSERIVGVRMSFTADAKALNVKSHVAHALLTGALNKVRHIISQNPRTLRKAWAGMEAGAAEDAQRPTAG